MKTVWILEKYKENDEENTLTPDQMENIAVCDENLLEKYLETGSIEEEEIAELITQRKIFPCYFGSALKEDGVEDFWNGVQKYTREPKRPVEFGAKVFKIARDEQGNRLTYMKITGGSLKAKTHAFLQSERTGFAGSKTAAGGLGRKSRPAPPLLRSQIYNDHRSRGRNHLCCDRTDQNLSR